MAPLDGSPSLIPAQIVSSYVPSEAQHSPDGAPLSITEKDGSLHEQSTFFVNGSRETMDLTLLPGGGDRLIPQGAPSGSASVLFFVRNSRSAFFLQCA